MYSAAESSSRYLTLALSARGAMKALRPVAMGDPTPADLPFKLTKFLLDLPGDEHASYLRHMQDTGAAPSFEEVSTFEETLKAFDVAALGAALRTFVRGDRPGRERESAKQLLQFFGAIETRALSSYANYTQARTA